METHTLLMMKNGLESHRMFGRPLMDILEDETEMELQAVLWDCFHNAKRSYVMVKEFQQRRAFTRGTDG